MAKAAAAAARNDCDDDRLIFRFHDGRKERAVDPLATWLELDADPEFNMETHPAQIDAGEPAAIRIALAATRRVLKIETLEAGGLTDLECLDLLKGFWAFMSLLKKSGDGSPISSSPTESPPLEDSTTASE